MLSQPSVNCYNVYHTLGGHSPGKDAAPCSLHAPRFIWPRALDFLLYQLYCPRSRISRPPRQADSLTWTAPMEILESAGGLWWPTTASPSTGCCL